MGKKGNSGESKSKKAPDVTMQKVKKARKCLKSGGKRGLDAFLAANADIKNHAEIKKLVQKAANLPEKAPKGKRGPAPKVKVDPNPQPREEGQSSFGSLKGLREAYKADPENTTKRVMAEAAEGEVVNV